MKPSAIMRLRGCVRLLSVGVIVLLGSVSLSAQSNTGRILGSITDQSGGAIANAPVTVTNVQTGVARVLTADGAGEYVAPNLIPGTYSVHVAVMGFKTTERQNILLETGKDVRIDVELVPGEVTQTVQVTEAVPLIDSTSVTIGGTLSNATINDLPLNGRNYQNLLVLRPGLFITPGGGSLTQTTNGLRPEDQNYLIEGLDSNDAFSGQSIANSTLPSGDAATILPIDAIQEFNSEVNGPAEFGRKPGAVINVGLKSGTNTLHGTAYAFGRSDAFDARNYFDPPPLFKAPLDLEQFGGSAGGPIIKEKLFYFGAYEEQRYTVGNASARTILSTAAGAGPTGSLPDATAALQTLCAGGATAFKGCAGGTFTVNQISNALLPYFGTNSGPTAAVTGYGFPNVIKIDNAVGKVDYNLNSHHAFNGSYFFGNGTSTSEDAPRTEAIFRSVGRLRSQFVTSNWTWTPSSNWVNAARVGWTYYNRPVFPFDVGTPPTAYGINTGITNPILFGMPGITVTGLTPSIGAGTNWPSLRGPNSNYDFVDQVSYLRGKHAFKFGGEILYSLVTNTTENNGRGSFSFTGGQAFTGSTGLEDFLAGVPKSVKVLVGSPLRHVTQKLYAGFLQDSWRVTSKVTLNLGVRYDYDTVIKERDNLLGNWSPAAGLEQVGVNLNSAYNGYHKDLAPHVGAAWDLTGKGTTILRAGGSLVFDDIPITEYIYHVGFTNVGMDYNPTGNTLVLPNGTVQPPVNPSGGLGFTAAVVPGTQLTWLNSATQVLPASLANFTCGNGIQVDPTKAVSGANPLNPVPCQVFAANPNLANPYVGTWTVSLQHAFTHNVSLEVAYVGNHAGNLTGAIDFNQPPAGSGGAACTLPAAGKANTALNCEQVARPYYQQYPYLGEIVYLDSNQRSNYHGLQTTLTTRNYHNLSVILGYTYSHALDDLSHYFSLQVPQDSTHPDLSYGNSDFDLRHHFTLSTTYNLPGKKSFGQMLEGWQLNSIVHLQSGLPWSAVDTSGDVSLSGELQDRWDFFGNPKDFTPGPQNVLTGIPFYKGGTANMPAACTQAAASIGTTSTSLAQFGCYSQGGSALIAAPLGTFGTAGRNIFTSDNFRNWDVSIFKIWKVKERYSAQFRAEFFNVLNRPDFYNQIGSPSSSGSPIGCRCLTPDQGSTNPTLGSGGPRAIQFGLKLGF
jgi:hypothetical protein